MVNDLETHLIILKHLRDLELEGNKRCRLVIHQPLLETLAENGLERMCFTNTFFDLEGGLFGTFPKPELTVEATVPVFKTLKTLSLPRFCMTSTSLPKFVSI